MFDDNYSSLFLSEKISCKSRFVCVLRTHRSDHDCGDVCNDCLHRYNHLHILQDSFCRPITRRFVLDDALIVSFMDASARSVRVKYKLASPDSIHSRRHESESGKASQGEGLSARSFSFNSTIGTKAISAYEKIGANTKLLRTPILFVCSFLILWLSLFIYRAKINSDEAALRK